MEREGGEKKKKLRIISGLRPRDTFIFICSSNNKYLYRDEIFFYWENVSTLDSIDRSIYRIDKYLHNAFFFPLPSLLLLLFY